MSEAINVLEQILIVVGVTILVMISPGPDMVIVMRNTLIGGRSAGLLSSLGVLAGNAVHIAYCVLGIGWLISQSIVAFSILKYAGAVYLIFLGISSLRSSGSPIDTTATDQPRTSRRWLVQGFVSNVLNPKGTLFYLGVFTVVIAPETSWAAMLVLILCMKLVSATFWLAFVFTLDRPLVRRFFEHSQKTVNRIFGALLIGLGLRVAALDR